MRKWSGEVEWGSEGRKWRKWARPRSGEPFPLPRQCGDTLGRKNPPDRGPDPRPEPQSVQPSSPHARTPHRKASGGRPSKNPHIRGGAGGSGSSGVREGGNQPTSDPHRRSQTHPLTVKVDILADHWRDQAKGRGGSVSGRHGIVAKTNISHTHKGSISRLNRSIAQLQTRDLMPTEQWQKKKAKPRTPTHTKAASINRTRDCGPTRGMPNWTQVPAHIMHGDRVVYIVTPS